MGMTMKEGTVEEWYVREGDQVKTGDPLFSASTDKITNDVESQEDGMILKIVAQAGETVDVSAVVGYIGKPGEQVPDAPEEKQTLLRPITLCPKKSMLRQRLLLRQITQSRHHRQQKSWQRRRALISHRLPERVREDESRLKTLKCSLKTRITSRRVRQRQKRLIWAFIWRTRRLAAAEL